MNRPTLFLAPTVIAGLALAALLFRVLPSDDTLLSRGAALEWFQKPAAIRITGQRDQTVVSYLRHSGQVLVRTYDHTTARWQEPTKLVYLPTRFGRAAIDDHNPPSLLALDDGVILAFTAVHDRTDALGFQRTVRVEDTTEWTEWQPIFSDTKLEYDYPQAKALPNGNVILFFRMGTWRDAQQAYSLSSDGGQTWSRPSTLIDFGSNVGIYALIHQRRNELHLAWNVRRGSGRPSELYYAVSRDNGQTWETSTGKKMAVPLVAEQSELVVDADEPLFVWDIQTTVDGQPRIAMIHGQPDHTQYAVARWEGSAWRLEDIASTKLLYGGTHYYAGGIVFDPRNPDQALLSRGGRDLQLELWSRLSDGWRRQRVVSGRFSQDNIRPQFVAGDQAGGAIWLSGQYDGFDGREWSGFERLNLLYQSGI